MKALTLLLRVFSYLFHGLLAAFLLAVSGLALSSGTGKLSFPMLPWTGDTLIFVLFFGSLAGLLALLLALGQKTRVLFFLWSLLVAALLLKGYVFSWYRFAPGEIRTAAWLLPGAALAAAGAWPRVRQRSRY